MDLNKKATVLLPVYNGEDYIETAIQSLLDQTFKDFDILLIDDGSTDNSANIIDKFNDDRLVYLKNERNMGITRTLNKGLDLIKSEYIIRMDSDDICYPERFAEQITFMEKHPEIVIAGSNVRQFSDKNWDYITSVNTKPKEIRTELLFNCPLKHPSVIMRNSIMKEEKYYYSTEHKATEDYGLWRKISEKYDLGNVDKVLMDYRIHDEGISVKADKNKEKRDKAHIIIYKESFDQLKVTYTPVKLQLYRNFITHEFDFTEENSMKLKELLLNLKERIQDNHQFDIDIYEKLVSGFFRMNFQKQQKKTTELIKVHNKYFKDVFKLKYIDMAKLNLRNIQSKFNR